MVAIPAWLGAASRVLRRGSFYLMPPIRISMPVNINAGSSRQFIKVGERVIHPGQIHALRPLYEYKWSVPNSDWSSPDINADQYRLMTKQFGEPEVRIFGGELVVNDGEVIQLDRRQYWKVQGYLIQSGIEI
jgi:hypothetical protein